MQVRSLGWEDPVEEEMLTHSSILAWKKSHGSRSLVGYSPKGCKAWDTTERLSTTAHSFGTDSSKNLTGPWLLQGLLILDCLRLVESHHLKWQPSQQAEVRWAWLTCWLRIPLQSDTHQHKKARRCNPTFAQKERTLRASLVALMVQNPPAMQETWVRSLGWEDPLEEGVTTHSSILPRIPWTEETGRLLLSMGSQKAGHDWATKHTHTEYWTLKTVWPTQSAREWCVFWALVQLFFFHISHTNDWTGHICFTHFLLILNLHTSITILDSQMFQICFPFLLYNFFPAMFWKNSVVFILWSFELNFKKKKKKIQYSFKISRPMILFSGLFFLASWT